MPGQRLAVANPVPRDAFSNGWSIVLRVALIDMTEMADPGSPGSLEWSVAGVPVARHQIALALALGCERIVCLSRHVSPVIIDMQHLSETRGAGFHLVRTGAQLVGLVAADDQLLVLERGAHVSMRAAAKALEQGHCICVLPVTPGMAAGFERIDLEHSAAGIALLPGRLLSQTTDLPDDFDVASALRRIALQSGIRRSLVPEAMRDNGEWLLVRDRQTAQAAAAGWLAGLDTESPGIGLGHSLARWIVRNLGADWLARGWGMMPLVLASLTLAAMASGIAFAGYPAVGLVLLGLGWLSGELANDAGRMEHALGSPGQRGWLSAHVMGWLTDAGLIIIPLLFAARQKPGNWLTAVFAPLMLVIFLRLLPRLGGQWQLRLGEDRFSIAVLLAVASFPGFLGIGFQVLAIGCGLAALWVVSHDTRLTRL